MENKLLCKPVILPTEMESRLFVKEGKLQHCFDGGALIAYDPPNWLTYQLYLVSDREIKEGEWFVYEYKRLLRANKESLLLISEGPSLCKRIEATSDVSLGLPLIPELFIKEYVQEQGKIDKVYFQLEVVNLPYPNTDEWGPASRLKLTPFPGNEVIILPVKDSWNREELKIIAEKAYWQGSMKWPTTVHFQEWFDKNY